MNMTDEELDRDWQPNGRRPQSTIARSFSQELMDIFRIENSVADLDEQVLKRKQQLSSQTNELEALEARIREMEKRLQAGTGTTPSGSSSASKQGQTRNGAPTSPRSQRPPVAGVFDKDSQNKKAPEGDEMVAKDQKYGSSRPGTARPQNQQAVPGALPPTPVASEGEPEPAPSLSSSSSQKQQLAHQPSGVAVITTSTAPEESERETNNAAPCPPPGEDPGSVWPDDESASFADYVVVPAQDGDGDHDA